jgi:hypothetical protein
MILFARARRHRAIHDEFGIIRLRESEDISTFIGDNWHPKQNLTQNLGLRYEWQMDCA